MNGADLKKSPPPVRGMLVGYPKAGKTPALAALLNAGWKVRLLNFEGNNWKSLVEWCDERALANLDVLTFADPMHMGERWMEPLGDPKAFNESVRAMVEWKGLDAKGKPYTLGKPSEWGPDTVVALDGMTSQGEAIYNRAMKALNRTPGNFQIQDWQFVVSDQMKSLKYMGNPARRYHFLVLAHLQMVGPQEVNPNDKEETNKEIKRNIAELITPRIYPKAATRNMSTFIAKEFPMIVKVKAEGSKRVILTEEGENIDLAVPFKGAKRSYSLTTGLAELFEGWGWKAPGFGKGR